MINAVQIRSARALLDWSTSDLARRAGMTINAINRIERGRANAQRSTIGKLEDIFESVGIEFLPNSGLRKKDKNILIYEGKDSGKELVGDVLNSLKGTAGELLIANADKQLMSEYLLHENMKEKPVRQKSAGITRRLLVTSREKPLPHPLQLCHVIPETYFSVYPLWLYGTKLALSAREFSPKAVIIDNAPIAESIKNLFEYIWDNTPALSNFCAPGKNKKNSGGRIKGKCR